MYSNPKPRMHPSAAPCVVVTHHVDLEQRGQLLIQGQHLANVHCVTVAVQQRPAHLGANKAQQAEGWEPAGCQRKVACACLPACPSGVP